MWRIKQLHTINLTYQARFFVRGERPTELLNINFSSKFDKDLGIYYYFCNKWSVKTTLKQCHASVLNNISSIHQPLKQHTHTYTTLTPWNFHLKSSSNDWNPRSATFFLYHTRRPGWTISLSLATPPTQPRTQVSERTIIVTTLNHRWPQGQPWSGRVSLKWFFCIQCYFHCTEIVKAKFCICHDSTGIVSSWHVQKKNGHTQTWILRSKAISFCKVSSPRILLVKCLPWSAWGTGPMPGLDHDSTNFVNWA